MGIFIVLVWFGIGLLALYGTTWLVTGRKPEDWSGLMTMALMIPFIESLRYWPLLFVINRALVIWLRIGAAVVVIVMLYIYAHLRLGLTEEWRNWVFATLYPGIKLILFFMIKKLPN